MKKESIDYFSIITRENLLKELDKAISDYREDISDRLKELYKFCSKELNYPLKDLRDFSLNISLEGMKDYHFLSDCIHYRRIEGISLITSIEGVELLKIDNRFIHYEMEFRYGYSYGIIFQKDDLEKVLDWIIRVKKKKVRD